MSTTDLQTLFATTAPFDQLPAQQLSELVAATALKSYREKDVVTALGTQMVEFYLIISGEIEVQSATGKIFGRLARGETFGIKTVREGKRASYQAVATRDTQLAAIPRTSYDKIIAAFPEFDKDIVPLGAERFGGDGAGAGSGSQVNGGQSAGLNLMTVTTRDLMTENPITVTPQTSILDAARLMRARDISCLPITQGDALVGMVTDGDLRDRVLAEGLPTDRTVAEIMTPDPITLPSAALAFDALVTMMQRQISHLPVTRDGKLVGILTHTNLVRAQSRSAVYMIGEIHRLKNIDDIAEIVGQIPQLLASLVEAGASAHKIGHIITSIADATTVRLIRMAEDEFGPPPVPYLWLACGSQGRQEQTGVSDQDNCIFINDTYDADAHGSYFEKLTKFVCDGLDRCGYVYCPGDMMAMNPKWCQPLHAWREYFRSWIDTPQPMAQMLASVMFDLRPIYGKRALFEAVQTDTLKAARSNSIFIAHMVSNSLKHAPPIGLFGQMTTTKTGDGRHAVDMKHAGVVPIVDIARVYALTASIPEVNTHRRLEAGREASVLSEDGARSLLAAFEFISMTRLRHQTKQIRAGKKPDNFMVPNEISPLERTQLKGSFQIVKTIQSSLANARQMGG